MKRIKVKTFLQSALLLIAVITLASCSKSAPKYARLIDKDAPFVLSVNVKQIGEKAELGENKKVTKKLKDLLKDQGLSANTKKKLTNIIEDPAEAGVDLREPLLIFVDDLKEGKGGMVGALHDSGKFTNLLTALAKESDSSAPEKDGELTKMMIGSSMLVYNDEWFYFNPQAYDEDEAFDYISERFKSDDEQSIRSREDFKEMCKYDGDMQMLLSGVFYEQSLGYSDMALLQKLMPSDLEMADFSTLFDLNTDKSEAELTIRALALTDNAKEYLKKNENWVKDINGELLKYVPKSSWFVAATNLNGEELYDIIRSSLKDSDELSSKDIREIKKVLTSFNGDMIVCCNGASGYDYTPKMLFLAQVKDNKILDLVKDSYSWEKTPSGSYTMYGGATVGVKNNILYFSNDESVSGLPSANGGVNTSDFKGKPFYAMLNFKQLLRLQNVRDMIDNNVNAKAIKKITDSLDKMDFWLEDNTTVKMRLKLTKDINPLALLSSVIEEFEAPSYYNDADYGMDDAYGEDTAYVEMDSVVADYEY